MPLKDFNETFADELRDPDFAAAYLEAVLENEGMEAFFAALKNVVKAHGGMTKVAKDASLGRESLYKALSELGNPAFKTVHEVLGAMGMHLTISRNQSKVAMPT
jgi:probable addiction module antidote protein